MGPRFSGLSKIPLTADGEINGHLKPPDIHLDFRCPQHEYFKLNTLKYPPKFYKLGGWVQKSIAHGVMALSKRRVINTSGL